MKLLKSCLLSLFLTACANPPLSVFTEYISVETLPSYIIGTPDPHLYCPDFGEKIHITWAIPQDTCIENLKIRLFLRFGNGEDEQLDYTLLERSGTLVFRLLNEAYSEKQGVFTYKIELYAEDALISTWLHQLWAEKITFQE